MNFGTVFEKAWKTIWHNKILWLFGLMASLLGSPNFNANSFRYETSGNWSNLPMGMQNMGMGFEQMMERIGEPNLALILTLMCVGLLLALAFTFLGTVGQAALVKGVWGYNEDPSRKLHFGALFKEGLRYFWKLIALNLLVFAVGIVVVIVVVILSVVTLGIGAILFACLAIPLAIAFSLLMKQTVISIVAEDLGIFDAVQHAWDFVFQQHLGNYLLMGLIVGVGGAIVSVLMALPFMVMALPMFGSLAFGGDTAITGSLMLSIILGLAYLPFYLVLSGGLRAFIESVWTIFYRDLRFAHGESNLTPAELEASLPGDGSMH